MESNDHRRFRTAAAGLIKGVIRARLSLDPHFLSPNDRRRWGVQDADRDTRAAAEHLVRVRQLRERFERSFLNSQDSIPSVDAANEADSFDALVDQVATFIVGDLDETIRQANEGKNVRWDKLARWNSLAKLRESFDRLPKAKTEKPGSPVPEIESKQVILFGLRNKPSVKGRLKKPLGEAQYKLIRRLIQAGDAGCSKSELLGITSNYWKSLNALKKSDRDWKSVIHFPGTSHRGYWID